MFLKICALSHAALSETVGFTGLREDFPHRAAFSDYQAPGPSLSRNTQREGSDIELTELESKLQNRVVSVVHLAKTAENHEEPQHGGLETVLEEDMADLSGEDDCNETSTDQPSTLERKESHDGIMF